MRRTPFYITKKGGVNLKKPIVKYYIGGEYREATVGDIGDIEQLTTSIKTDLVSAINSIADGAVGSKEVIKLKEDLEKVQNEIGNLENVSDQLTQGQGKISEEYQKLSKELEQSISKIVEEVKPMILESIEGVDLAKKDLKTIKEEYSSKISEINSNVESVKKGVENALDKLEQHKSELETMEIGVTKVIRTIDEVKGTLQSYVKTSEFELSEAKIKQNTLNIETNSKELKAKANQKELDYATGRISEFETELKATAKEVNSKLSRQEVFEEISKSNKYAPNLFKGTREWEEWKISGNGVLITSETYQNKKIVEISDDLGAITITQNDLTIGETYTASMTVSTTSKSTKLVLKCEKDIEMENSNGDTILTLSYQRVFATFVADKEKMTISFKVKGLLKNETVNITSAKLELGSKNTEWQDHIDDIYRKTFIYETNMRQMAEAISTSLKSVESVSNAVKKNSVEINATAKGVEEAIKSINEVDGKVIQVETDIKKVAGQVTFKISKTQLDDAIENISYESSNLILNSDFSANFDKWSLVDKKYKLEVIEGKKFAVIQRSGLKVDSIAALTSNAFKVSKGEEISVSFDIMINSLVDLDNKNIVYIELFDKSDKRVMRKDYSLSQLKGSVHDGQISRLGFKSKIDRNDVVKAKITLGLYKNGHIGFSRLNVTKGSITSFGWAPASSDADIVTAKLETKIDQKADSLEVNVVKESIDRVTNNVEKSNTEWKAEADKITQRITNATQDKVSKTEMLQEANKFSQQVIDVEKKVTGIKVGATNLIVHNEELKNQWISNDGNIVKTGTASIMKDYIKVRPGEILTFQQEKNEDHFRWAWYDTEKKFIARQADNRINFQWTVPKNVVFIRVGYPSGWRVKLERGNLATDYSIAQEDQVNKDTFEEANMKISKLEHDSSGFKQTVLKIDKDIEGHASKITEISQKSNEIKLELAESQKTSNIRAAMSGGKCLYTDVDFRKGMNGVVLYNNSQNSNIELLRESTVNLGSSNPSDSTHRIKVIVKGVANPGHGGFHQYIKSRSNAVFVQKIVAMIPKGRSIKQATSSIGTGGKGGGRNTWLTSTDGTGDWEEYILLRECGSTAPFSNSGHIFVDGGAIPTAANPLVWYIDSATVIDITSSSSVSLQLMNDSILAKVEKDGIIGSINATVEKAVISFDKIEMNGKVTFSHLDSQVQGTVDQAVVKANTAIKEVNTASSKIKDVQNIASMANDNATMAINNANMAFNNANDVLFQINSWKRPGTTLIDGGNIYADSLNVSKLSSIVSNMGTITAGKLVGDKIRIDLEDGEIFTEGDYLDGRGEEWNSTSRVTYGTLSIKAETYQEKINNVLNKEGLVATATDKWSSRQWDYKAVYGCYGSNLIGQNNEVLLSMTTSYSSLGGNHGVIEFGQEYSSNSYESRILGLNGGLELESDKVTIGGEVGPKTILAGNVWKKGEGSFNMYICPDPNGSLSVKGGDYTGSWRPVMAAQMQSHIEEGFVGNAHATSMVARNGYMCLRAANGVVYLQGKGGVKCTAPGSTTALIPIAAQRFNTGSKAEYKTNIELLEGSGLKIINDTNIYEYNFKTDEKDGITKKSIGVVIGEGYKTPTAVADDKSVDLYSMSAVSWKAVQELSQQLNESNKRLKILENKLKNKGEK